jgi:hypothetical protein
MNTDNSLNSYPDAPNSPELSDSLNQTYTSLTDNSPPDMSPFFSTQFENIMDMDMSLFDFPPLGTLNETDQSSNYNFPLASFGPPDLPFDGNRWGNVPSRSNWKKLDEVHWEALISQLTDYEQVIPIHSRFT